MSFQFVRYHRISFRARSYLSISFHSMPRSVDLLSFRAIPSRVVLLYSQCLKHSIIELVAFFFISVLHLTSYISTSSRSMPCCLHVASSRVVSFDVNFRHVFSYNVLSPHLISSHLISGHLMLGVFGASTLKKMLGATPSVRFFGLGSSDVRFGASRPHQGGVGSTSGKSIYTYIYIYIYIYL